MEATIETAKEKKPSLIGLITSPAKQFERMRERPAIWLPMIIVAVLSALAAYLVISKSAIFGQEDLNTVRSTAIIVRNIFQSVIFFVLGALVLWLLAKIGGGKTNFITMLSLIVFVNFIPAIRDIIINVIYYLTGSDIVFSVTALDGLIPAEEPLGTVLNACDIFTIWSFALTAIGLQKAGGSSKRAAWIGVAVLFILKLLLAYLYGMLLLLLINSPS
ncbi:hypothetical protein ACH95_08930 [Bacillus glycinifermentans]|uniref:Yip1 family protein n=1 Tax=Bacillus glycinifermentans TaxID=1664069 RepID=A0A0J6ESI7_9BACI|nr:Yip1 family protein [Bacillus glycinifermentans]ATH91250.1 YIP1 family protein [Bacillus glycinifermentans]KMM60518.1 hypothetical protein ACH95_08930 [Bacillus glycinifermentans]KRT93466.1 hypothetical protein AB447_218955 [Bacillus glycinifermentans]MEC0485449.1 Yip1 family protein [Bacillus glycinifermentans]MEC0495365.1 Yip1 family protein [Bacillus glycinifermentans]